MIINWTINFGDLIVLVTILGSVVTLLVRFGGIMHGYKEMEKDITHLQGMMEKITDILIQLSTQKERLDSQGARLNMMDQRLEDLRRGDGFIVKSGSQVR